MNNKYNVMITYTGEGTFKFVLRKIGEVEIDAARPVYIYNADVDTINNLRALRRLRINIQIGVKPIGAFRIFNMDDYVSAKTAQIREHVAEKYVAEPVSNAEVAAILKGGSTPEPVTTEEDKVEEKPVEEPKEEKKPAKKTTAKKTTTKKTTAKKTTKK